MGQGQLYKRLNFGLANENEDLKIVAVGVTVTDFQPCASWTPLLSKYERCMSLLGNNDFPTRAFRGSVPKLMVIGRAFGVTLRTSETKKTCLG